MKIALATIGSRGDIQPYIALGIALKKSGYDVTIATHPWAKEILSSYELNHSAIGSNIDINYAARMFVENSASSIKGLKFALNFIFTVLRDCHADLMEVTKNADLVIGHGIVGNSEANMLGKPFVSVSIETMGLQKEYWKTNNFLKEFGIYLGDSLKGFMFGKPYKNYRKEIGAPPASSTQPKPYLALLATSKFLQKPNYYWKDRTEITGFFFADSPTNFTPTAELIEFISSGDKPILITFGSMFHRKEETEKLFTTICEAVTLSHSRALLLMPDLDVKTDEIPNNIFPINNIPYSWLLKQVTLVVHHFGFGTTAEVLKAGLPSIPIPHIFDQKARAKQIYNLGFASKPLNIQNIDANTLANEIASAKANCKIYAECLELSSKIAEEKGVEIAVELITDYINQL
ncbi:MAG TPA: glycosyltransferase [Tenuifilaceae bacterium]|nr:glycosyltransferase [Tenuifilaceae bacterium]